MLRQGRNFTQLELSPFFKSYRARCRRRRFVVVICSTEITTGDDPSLSLQAQLWQLRWTWTGLPKIGSNLSTGVGERRRLRRRCCHWCNFVKRLVGCFVYSDNGNLSQWMMFRCIGDDNQRSRSASTAPDPGYQTTPSSYLTTNVSPSADCK